MIEKVVIRTAKDVEAHFEDILHGKKKAEILLPVPVTNILYCYRDSAPLCLVLGLSAKDVSLAAGYCRWIVTDPGTSGLKKCQFLTEKEVKAAKEKFGEGSFRAVTGAEALAELLDSCDLEEMYKSLKTEECELIKTIRMEEKNNECKEDIIEESCDDEENEESELDRLYKKLTDKQAMLDAVSCMMERRGDVFISRVHILPMEVRPMAERTAESEPYTVMHDIEYDYEKLANRAERLIRLTELGAPDPILYSEKRHLQQAVDILLGNSLIECPVMKENGRPVSCLMDVLMRSVPMY